MQSAGGGDVFATQPVLQPVGTEVVAYWKAGSGPPVILIHGWPFHSQTWAALVARLASAFTLIAPDTPGLGASQWQPETDFSFTGHARRLEADRKFKLRFPWVR